MRLLLRAVVAASAAGCAVLASALAAQAAGSGSITTAPAAEGWHRTAPVCALPTGCPADPSSPYSADTLHVGVNLGQEEARTTLLLDLSQLPAGTKPAGGELRLPLATGAQDGTRSPASARMQACVVTEPVQDVDGSFAAAPAANCDAGSAEAVFVPATEQAPAAFTVDLTALASAWEDSPAPGALALLPAEDTAPPETWHVAAASRDRKGDGVATITAAVTYVSSAVDTVTDPAPFVAAPVDTGLSDPPAASFDSPLSAGPSLDFPVSAAAAPAPAGEAAAPQTAPEQVVPVAASFVDASFRYPAVFLLPLLVALAAGWIGRAMTRDLATTPT